jgi:hypothetical protein
METKRSIEPSSQGERLFGRRGERYREMTISNVTKMAIIMMVKAMNASLPFEMAASRYTASPLFSL